MMNRWRGKAWQGRPNADRNRTRSTLRASVNGWSLNTNFGHDDSIVHLQDIRAVAGLDAMMGIIKERPRMTIVMSLHLFLRVWRSVVIIAWWRR
jgi:hypothetical protein